MTEPWGNSPRLVDEEFVQRINKLGHGPGAAARFQAALTAGSGNLIAALGSLLGVDQLPEHVLEYLEAVPQFEPVFLGVMASVADRGTFLKLTIEDASSDNQLTLTSDAGVLVLGVRAM